MSSYTTPGDKAPLTPRRIVATVIVAALVLLMSYLVLRPNDDPALSSVGVATSSPSATTSSASTPSSPSAAASSSPVDTTVPARPTPTRVTSTRTTPPTLRPRETGTRGPTPVAAPSTGGGGSVGGNQALVNAGTLALVGSTAMLMVATGRRRRARS